MDRLLEALAIWREEKEKHSQHTKLCAAAGKEVNGSLLCSRSDHLSSTVGPSQATPHTNSQGRHSGGCDIKRVLLGNIM